MGLVWCITTSNFKNKTEYWFSSVFLWWLLQKKKKSNRHTYTNFVTGTKKNSRVHYMPNKATTVLKIKQPHVKFVIRLNFWNMKVCMSFKKLWCQKQKNKLKIEINIWYSLVLKHLHFHIAFSEIHRSRKAAETN